MKTELEYIERSDKENKATLNVIASYIEQRMQKLGESFTMASIKSAGVFKDSPSFQHEAEFRSYIKKRAENIGQKV